MIRVLLIVFAVLMVSCKGDEQVAYYKEHIIGDWKNIPNPVKDEPAPPPSFYTLGYGFEPNGIFECKMGFYDDKMQYKGNYSVYEIEHDSLKLTYKGNDDYQVNSKIERILNDTLVLSFGKYRQYFLRKKSDTINTPDFDEIIITHSGGMFPPRIKNVFIKNDGNVVYDKYDTLYNHKWFIANISAKEVAQIKTRFKKANWPELKPEYGSFVYDGGHMLLSIISRGKIMKSVIINPMSGNAFLDWAVVPTGNLPYKLNGSEQDFSKLVYMKYFSFLKDGKVLSLTESESYYLSYLLNKAPESKAPIKEDYTVALTIDAIKKIMTDGRFYKFYYTNGATKTVDIGYDFIKESKLLNHFE